MAGPSATHRGWHRDIPNNTIDIVYDGTEVARINATTFGLLQTLQPATDNGAALGTTSQRWSDLFLAEGGAVNWDDGDMTLTQVGNVLTVAGGDLAIADGFGLVIGSTATVTVSDGDGAIPRRTEAVSGRC